MDPVSWVGLTLILVLTVVSTLLVLAENAVLELSQTALDALDSTEPRAARRIRILLENRFRFWASARIGAAVLIFASAALAATTVGEQLGTLLGTRPGGVVAALAILCVLHTGGARVNPAYPRPTPSPANRPAILVADLRPVRPVPARQPAV